MMWRLSAWIEARLWAVTPALAEDLRALIERRIIEAIRLDPIEVTARIEAARTSPADRIRMTEGAVAVVPITGVLTHRARLVRQTSVGEATAAEQVEAALLAAAEDPHVRHIVLDIDSPGGAVDGIPELAATIREIRQRVPITAVANSLAASAAYWLASQASEIVATPSATLGSIGVYAMHIDRSGELAQRGQRVTLVGAGPHKLDGHPYGPLPEDVRTRMQARVDATYRRFVTDVALGRGRGMTPERVEAEYGGGDVLSAEDALQAGAVDRIATLRTVLRSLGASSSTQALTRADLDYRRRRVALARAKAQVGVG